MVYWFLHLSLNSWTPSLTPNGVIIAYEVSYRPTDSSDPKIRLNTTDLETSFTTQSDLEEGTEFIFSVRAYTRVGPGNTSSINVSTLGRKSKMMVCNNCAFSHTFCRFSFSIYYLLKSRYLLDLSLL